MNGALPKPQGAESAAARLECREDPDREQIRERLTYTPAERLRYLLDMLAFEERARRYRRLS